MHYWSQTLYCKFKLTHIFRSQQSDESNIFESSGTPSEDGGSDVSSVTSAYGDADIGLVSNDFQKVKTLTPMSVSERYYAFFVGVRCGYC